MDIDEQCYEDGFERGADDAASEGSDHVDDIADAVASATADNVEELYAEDEKEFVRPEFVRGYLKGYTLA